MSLARQFAADYHRKYRLPIALSLSLLASLSAASGPRVTVRAARWHATRTELALENAALRAVFADATESPRLSAVRLKHQGRDLLLLGAVGSVLPRAPEAVDSVARLPDGFAVRRDLPVPDASRAPFWKTEAGLSLTGDAAELVLTEKVLALRDGAFSFDAFRLDLTPAGPLRLITGTEDHPDIRLLSESGDQRLETDTLFVEGQRGSIMLVLAFESNAAAPVRREAVVRHEAGATHGTFRLNVSDARADDSWRLTLRLRLLPPGSPPGGNPRL